ncbi:TetR/AcrR family transcriptional regulator [Microbacterium aoyamense]|uniref:TetR/AcrR family transcriptional regulator n=1 Tax=Microbacterium aoyamense TaxID=344166 RepID=UPI002003B431|nr:TetR/AcrR family transcriptional regulator [Microbacterium aoyamense]
MAKREEILTVALEHFARRGYDRASVREIARESGLSQAGLLHHFSSKQELFLEVIRRRDDRDGDPVHHRHLHSVDHLISAVEHNVEEPGLVRLFVTMSAESVDESSVARSFFESRYDWLRGELRADIQSRQDAGEVPAELDADDLASLMVAAADGLQLQWLLQPDQVDMPSRLKTLWRLMTQGDDTEHPPA